MKFKDIKVNNKYVQVITVDTRKRGGRQRHRSLKWIYVLNKDEKNKKLLVSINKMPAEWVTHRQIAKWEENTEEVQRRVSEFV